MHLKGEGNKFRISPDNFEVALHCGYQSDVNRSEQYLFTCGIIVNFDLRSCKPKSEILMPSMDMWPDAASMMRNNARAKDDLPAPVLPTIPIFSPGFTEHVKSLRTKSNPGLYFVEND